jgi:hypothetical protein
LNPCGGADEPAFSGELAFDGKAAGQPLTAEPGERGKGLKEAELAAAWNQRRGPAERMTSNLQVRTSAGIHWVCWKGYLGWGFAGHESAPPKL